MAKPNILFLLNDHQAHYRHGWDQGPTIRRPNFDKLALEGVAFERAYCTSPLCGPARRSMLTGLFPHNHQEITNDVNHPYDRGTYLDILADNGYQNFYYGKWHAGPGTALDHQCEGFSYTGYNNPYTKQEYKAYLEKKGLPEPEILVEKTFRYCIDPNVKDGDVYRQDGGWCNAHASGIMKTPKDTHEAFFLAHLACEKLEELAESKGDRPFALRVDFWGPHQPYFPTQEYADLYPPEDIPEYGSFRDTLEEKPGIYRTEFNRIISDHNRLIQPNPLPWSDWQKVLSRCYAQITMVDEAGGMILDTLKKLGLEKNTLIIWTSDHGDAVACHGGHFDKGSYMPEEVLRIPMAVSYPGVIPRGIKSHSLVSNMDVAPTILDAAGLSFSQPVDGRSVLSIFKGTSDPWRKDIMAETHGHGEPHTGRALIESRYKYIANKAQMDELYDLVCDPYEMHNLISSSEHQDILSDMKKRLIRWQSHTGDAEQDIRSFG